MTTAAETDHGTRRTLEGWVVSDKMAKTRVVEIRGHRQHSKYAKVLHITTKVYAHDENNASKTGDRVKLMETRPLSRLKRWRVTEVLGKSAS
jgi:small subunit ribosomal protein S17